MIGGIGLDLCAVARMEELKENDRFMARYFTEEERAYVRSRGAGAGQTLAGLFAAKEALGKALGTGIAFDLREAEIGHGENGRPEYRLRGKLAEAAGQDRFHLSISHDGGVAGAVCIRDTDDILPKVEKPSIL